MEVKVLISSEALRRAKKDSFIKTQLAKYNQEIFLLASTISREASPENVVQVLRKARPSEKIGDFTVIPKGKKGPKAIRIAWTFTLDLNKQLIRIFIAELLYHEAEGKYVDNWNGKARKRDITTNTYSNYTPFRPF